MTVSPDRPMTVGDLRDALAAFPADAIVVFPHDALTYPQGGDYSPVLRLEARTVAWEPAYQVYESGEHHTEEAGPQVEAVALLTLEY